MSLQQSVVEALTALGRDADEVAERLKALGFTGRPSIVGDCPVARYLRASLHHRIAVGSWSCSWGSGGHFPLTPAVSDFVLRFDDGIYPELVDDAPHEDGCPAQSDACTCER